MEALRGAGVEPGDLVAVALAPGVGVGLAVVARDDAAGGRSWAVAGEGVTVVREVEEALGPRWVTWSAATAAGLAAAGVRLARGWDVVAVQRLLVGEWRMSPPKAWAQLHDLPPDEAADGPLDLFSQAGEGEGPVRGDGRLSVAWAAGGWAESPERLARWAGLAAVAAARQRRLLAELAATGHPAAPATARAESAAELLGAEMSVDGLPLDRATAEAVVAGFVGPRPRSEAEAAAQRAARDAEVLRHATGASTGAAVDLRSPAQVKALLRRNGVDVADTRAARLEALRDAHPLVDALLAWRKAERVATTYGYRWLDTHVGADGRLRGEWSSSDGAAGRMTASAGLHNMPADMREAVVAEPGHAFARADLGQVEPRVLAAVSGDAALARATAEDDLYAPVAAQLGVDRPTAKVAVLGAMYGQTTGHGAHALRRLRSAYPVAMAYLDDADRAAQAGRSLRTHGGRLVRMGGPATDGADEATARARAAARGRYGRNALVQGAAAELFKAWAATVRARLAAPGAPGGGAARIVLCLHDELLVHTPEADGPAVAALLDACLHEAAARWAPGAPVRFVADVSVVARWSDAKG